MPKTPKRFRHVDGTLYHYVKCINDKRRIYVMRFWVPWKRRWAYEVIPAENFDILFANA